VTKAGDRGPRHPFDSAPMTERLECLDRRHDGSLLVIAERIRFTRPVEGAHFHLRRCLPNFGWEWTRYSTNGDDQVSRKTSA